jgi:hypothetical protein
MGLLQKLFGRAPDLLAAGRGWTVNVVGESQFQHRLAKLKGGNEHDVKVTAVLMPEPTNTHDPRAVRVEIAGKPVGYLPRELACECTLKAPAQCSAKIVGGFLLDDDERVRAHYGVKLNLAWPPRLKV